MWKTRLKDSREVRLRFLMGDDKEQLFQMFSSMSDEALRWSMAPYTEEVIQRWIGDTRSRMCLVASYRKKIVGYASMYRFPHLRRKGVGDLAIYLHQDFHNVGLGTAMTERLLKIAENEGMHKIELTVVANNKSAISLYRKFGFEIEGVSKDSFFGSDGKYHDMVHMGLIL